MRLNAITSSQKLTVAGACQLYSFPPVIATCRVEDIFCNQILDRIELFVCFILQSCDRYSIWSSRGKREKFNQTKHLLIYSAWVY